MKKIVRFLAASLCALVTSSLPTTVSAQVKLLKQFKDGDAPQPMTDGELAELGDPFFVLVLKSKAGKIKLNEVEALLQPNAASRSVFVVSEEIANPVLGQARRAVIAFSGFNAGTALASNVMLSAIFTSSVFPTDPTATGAARLPFVEAWGFDPVRRRFNYYKMDSSKTGVASWRFRGSSSLADAADRAGTCFRCHLNGAPVMKELPFPWNNWHSNVDRAAYLDRLVPSSPPRWPVAADGHFTQDNPKSGLQFAPTLEDAIKGAISNHAAAEVDRQRNPPGSGGAPGGVTGAKRLLRHLFDTTEFNMGSAPVKSNMHPLSGLPVTKPAQPVEVPTTFFLNSALIGGETGLRIASAVGFAKNEKVAPDEYADAVRQSGVKINGAPGDANFAWLTPEASFIDNRIVEEALKQGLVPGQFAAAVMAVDLREPILSARRRGLLQHVPDSYRLPATVPADTMDVAFFQNHELTKQTINALRATPRPAGSPEAELLALLEMTEGVPAVMLEKRIKAYADEIKSKLGSTDEATRKAEVKRLHDILVARRRAVLQHPLLGALDETGGQLLLPVP